MIVPHSQARAAVDRVKCARSGVDAAPSLFHEPWIGKVVATGGHRLSVLYALKPASANSDIC